MAQRGRPFGLRLIIAYKFVKAPLMLSVAAALTFAPVPADHFLRHVAAQLSEWGAVGWRFANWIEPRLTTGVEHRAAALAWLDGTATLVEGILLLSGKVWGEWLVVAGLAVLLPFEVLAMVHRPTVVRAVILVVNALVVVYLVRDRLKARPRNQTLAS